MVPDVPPSAPVRVGPQGRLVIPAELRRAMNLEPGDELVARVEDEALVLERREMLVRRLQSLFDHVPADVSLVDELIAERRAEARRENAE
jgi:AbrB family looped-hinge helix DNA binding protein